MNGIIQKHIAIIDSLLNWWQNVIKKKKKSNRITTSKANFFFFSKINATFFTSGMAATVPSAFPIVVSAHEMSAISISFDIATKRPSPSEAAAPLWCPFADFHIRVWLRWPIRAGPLQIVGPPHRRRYEISVPPLIDVERLCPVVPQRLAPALETNERMWCDWVQLKIVNKYRCRPCFDK